MGNEYLLLGNNLCHRESICRFKLRTQKYYSDSVSK